MTLNSTPLRVALFEPRIPPNTGTIGRTCAAFGLPLALIEPLGFSIDDRQLKRAGLDYWPFIDLSVHQDFEHFLNSLPKPSRLIGCSRRGGQTLQTISFQEGDVLLFGREDIGLPDPIRAQCDQMLTIPMPCSADADGSGGVRSLNLSVACGIVSYHAGLKLQLW
ncbi:tRNA (cytidine(34)-2'-O)-methyltransferase [Synechococcus sp. MIT S9508]|uniref:tRNA (cytidine(34)-2'-O)-methyltransferase n=1 Tax=Synechococcus sp. MIT S9508 TaxID=1801629 RepID=UPI0007BC7B04|nr:tRNA (cytidine(34)-2'-O)-methyltransferase [Synechococcus sp. MIT S9508]KZR89584.1 tRNA (cytidine(34)-2'-O)-methyltransferase [Synechococcus sp. MIT S9508]